MAGGAVRPLCPIPRRPAQAGTNTLKIEPEYLRTLIRTHVDWAHRQSGLLDAHPRFKEVVDPVLSYFTFRSAGVNDAVQVALV